MLRRAGDVLWFGEHEMAQAFEERRRGGNGDMRKRAGHVREDMSALRNDLGQLRSDIGALVALQWANARERVDSGMRYAGEQVRAHPMTTIGAAAGVGLIAGLLLRGVNHRRDH